MNKNLPAIQHEHDFEEPFQDALELSQRVRELSGRAYKVSYQDEGETERKKIVADEIEVVEGGVSFTRDNGHVYIYPIPLDYRPLSDEEIHSWVKGNRKARGLLSKMFGGTSLGSVLS